MTPGNEWATEETFAKAAPETKPSRWQPVTDLASGSLTDRASLYVGVVLDTQNKAHLLSVSAVGTNGRPYKTILLGPIPKAMEVIRQAVAKYDEARAAAKKQAGTKK